MTWPLYRALLEHWKHEPPVALVAARYFQIPPRERVRIYSREEATAILTGAGFSFV
jgi:hypothetical protein